MYDVINIRSQRLGLSAALYYNSLCPTFGTLYHNLIQFIRRRRRLRLYDVWCVLARTKCTTRTSSTSHFATVDLFTGQLPKSDASSHGAKPSHGVKALSVGRHVRVRLALNFAALPAPPAELRSV